jgi:3'-phosphoadenosine 5'-phosphosulfate sulfotransferase (PAPS reductase)/FAD synthetase
MKRVLNLGAGTQSSVLMFLMEKGEIPRADYALFADTGWEPQEVYDHLDWLRQRTTIPIVTVQTGNIFQDAMRSQVAWSKESAEAAGSGRNRWASMPLFVLNNQRHVAGPGQTLWGVDDETYVVDLEEPDEGQIKRQCSDEYKIMPIRKWIKANIFGLQPRDRWPTVPSVVQVFGISHDEKQRMKAPEKWAMFEYPLVERRWNRDRVIQWAEEHFPNHRFPRSACIGCPFHSNDEWRHIRDTDAKGWRQAVTLDERIRNAGGMRGKVFLHRDCVPLKDADLGAPDTQQTKLDAGFQNECKGICGV